jgi:hypothetical protein
MALLKHVEHEPVLQIVGITPRTTPVVIYSFEGRISYLAFHYRPMQLIWFRPLMKACLDL